MGPNESPNHDHAGAADVLLQSSPLPGLVTRPDDHRILAVNERAARLLGISGADAAGRRITDFYVEPSERGRLVERLQREGHIDDVRLRMTKLDGSPLTVLASFRPITWRNEPAVFSVFHDISGQVAAEAALAASDRRLVAQSEALTSLTARYTNPGEPFGERLLSILEISARALEVERLSMWRFEGRGASIHCVGLYKAAGAQFESGATLHRQSAPHYFEALERERVIAATDARTDSRTREFLDTYLTPFGIGAMLDVPLRHDNTTVGVLCAEHVGGARSWSVDEQNFAISVANLIVVAITEDERNAAVERLADSEARARLIVDSAHDAFIGIDSAGKIAAWNVQAERTFGWSRDEAIGRNLAETIVPPAFRDAHNNGMRRFHKTGEAPVVNQRLELSALHRSGREFPVELTISSPMKMDGGFFFGAFLRDITERRERDAELRRAKESAEAATRAKSEFLANMSHELRTPLNGVLGYAQILQRDRALSATQHDALESIARCGSQLLDLINDVLDLSKIEAGRVEIESGPTDLATLLDDVTAILAEAADRKGLELRTAIAADVPKLLVLDSLHLRQVLLNLTGNAIKFTATGSVSVMVTRHDDRVQFDVVDTGPGIEAEALSEIFEAFAQTRAGAAAGGTGLGLTISDHLITNMGGSLEVESVPGRGSRFWFGLPLVASTDLPEPRVPAAERPMPPLDARLAPGHTLTALVVDDSVANRHILAGLLESAGVTVVTAAGGHEAIAQAVRHRPQVILMDLKMNDLDGLEATRRLRRDPATASIPVIAVTASALGDIRQATRDAGCVDYLAKPIRAQELFAMLQRHTAARLVSAGEASNGGPRAMDVDKRSAVAERLREAVGIGDVTDIHALARTLLAGDDAEAAVGEQITRLATSFDFGGLEALARTLESA
jgi:PAS domain S-box-containing protein